MFANSFRPYANSPDIVDSLLEYDALHDDWKKLPMTLSRPRYGVTAILISCNITNDQVIY